MPRVHYPLHVQHSHTQVSKADGRRVNTTVPGLVVTESSVASGGISALLANSSHTWMLAYPVFSMLMERPGGRQVGCAGAESLLSGRGWQLGVGG